ncbi:MAG: metallophosphoesterase, partial [Acidobacteriota bacterium]
MAFNRRKFLKRSLTATAATAVTGFGSYLYGTRLETEWLEIKKVDIPIANLDENLEGFRIALLSDFHLYPTTRLEFIEEVIAEANKLDADLAVLTGDFVQGTAEAIHDLAPALARLNPRHGIYCVLGNHDLWKGADLVRTVLEKNGMPVLHNTGLTLTHEGAPLYLAGVDDTWSGNPDAAAAMANHRDSIPAVLLSHEPDPADKFSRDPRISLQLSGHSHGGQVRVPGYGSPFLPP